MVLSNMCPRSTSNNRGHAPFTYSVLRSNAGSVFARSVSGADLFHLGLIEFPVVSALAGAALCRHVSHVVRVSAEKQMCRVTARRVVALVQDKKAVRNGATSKEPRKPVGQPATFNFSSQVSVAVTVFAVYPRPAAAQRRANKWPISIYVFPKPFPPRTRPSHVIPALGRAVKSVGRGFGGKACGAVSACNFDQFCFILSIGHGVTSETGCAVSRLVQSFQRLFEPLYFNTGTRCRI